MVTHSSFVKINDLIFELKYGPKKKIAIASKELKKKKKNYNFQNQWVQLYALFLIMAVYINTRVLGRGEIFIDVRLKHLKTLSASFLSFHF